MRRVFIALLCIMCVCSSARGESDIAELTERGKNLYFVRDYRGALMLFARALTIDRNNGEILDFMGWCHRYLGNWASAERFFVNAASRLSGASGAWVQAGLGETYLGAGHYKRAVEPFRTAIGLSPDDKELSVRCLKGMMYAYAGLGQSKALDEASALLARIDAAEAKSVRQDALALLERSRTSAPAKEEKTTDVVNREAGAIASSTKAPAASGGKADSWGFRLGGKIREGIQELERRKISWKKSPDSLEGEWFYTFLPPEPYPSVPAAIASSASDRAYVLCEYEEQLMRVRTVLFFENVTSPASYMESVMRQISKTLDGRFGSPFYDDMDGLAGERMWKAGEDCMVRVACTATMQNTLLVYVDTLFLPLFQGYLRNIR